MNRENKRIRTFKEFLIEQKHQQKVNEDVKIEVDWWDQCIVEVLQDLQDNCNGCFDWTVLGNYIKAKFAILGREWDEYIDNLYILEIKDLIWAHHSKSFTDGTYTDNAALHSKGVVVEQLAATIYDKLCEKLGDSTSTNTKIKVADCVPAPGPNDICDDLDVLPFEHKTKVKKYAEYIKEAYAMKVKDGESNACIEYCLNRIRKEVGSLDPDAVFSAAVKNADGKAKARMVEMYVSPMVEEYLKNNEVVICNLADTDDEQEQHQLVDDALEGLIFEMTDNVLFALYKINGDVDEEAE